MTTEETMDNPGTAPTGDASTSVEEQIHTKFLSLENELNGAVFERRQEIRGLMLAVLSRTHIFLLGPPGTAKSLLIDHLTNQIDGATLYKRLFTKFTQPEEVFGPVSIKELKEHDRFMRKVEGKLPTADFAFIDEIFKANSSIINAMLKIMNEREYENNGSSTKVPLQTMMSASNELPGTEELNAVWDRFPLKYVVRPIQDPGNKKKLLMKEFGEITTTLTLEEITEAQEAVEAVALPEEVVDVFIKTWQALCEKGIPSSDRRDLLATTILKANAWLDGRDKVSIDDLELLSNISWDSPDQIPVLHGIVLEHCNPYLRDAEELRDQAFDAWRTVNNAEPTERLTAASQAAPGISMAIKKLGDLKKDMERQSRDTTKVDEFIAESMSIRGQLVKMAVPDA